MKFPIGFICCVGLVSGAASMRGQTAATTTNRAAVTAAAATLAAKTERAANNKIKLSITPKPEARAEYKLFDSAGKEIAATIAARDGTVQAVLDPKQAYVLVPPKAAPRPLPLQGLPLPARYVSFNAASATNLGGLFLRPSRVPLTWDETAKAYTTDLFVGYEFQDGAEHGISPKTVQFFAEGSNARIQAESVEVIKSGVSGYQRVTLSTTDITGETHFTARASPADELKSSVSVQREPGSLQLALPSKEIAAFGVGSGTLTVTLLARDHAPLSAEKPLEILLSSKRLRLPASIELPAGKSSAEIEFRSAGYGSDGITAQSGALATTQDVRLIFPVAATVAALAGGALGGVARYFRNRRSPRKTKPLLARRAAEGILVGVIFVGAAWAGLVTINLSTGILGTPFGAFVLAAFSGYVGCAVLDRVANRTFKGLESPE